MPKKTTKKKNIDGKLDDVTNEPSLNNTIQGKKNVRSIDELLGKKNNLYSCKSLAEYEDKIKKMSFADLERHATEVGVFPSSNRTILHKRLITKFREVAGGYYNTIQHGVIQPKDPETLINVLNRRRY